MKTIEDKNICDEIIWWAKFLMAHGINPTFICENSFVSDEYDNAEEEDFDTI